eukprot:m51a1_g9255 hypothetical protein (1016) ;mRNA; r:31573-36442
MKRACSQGSDDGEASDGSPPQKRQAHDAVDEPEGPASPHSPLAMSDAESAAAQPPEPASPSQQSPEASNGHDEKLEEIIRLLLRARLSENVAVDDSLGDDDEDAAAVEEQGVVQDGYDHANDKVHPENFNMESEAMSIDLMCYVPSAAPSPYTPAKDLRAEGREAEERVVCSLLLEMSSQRKVQAKACAVGRLLAAHGLVREALSLAMVLRLVAQESPVGYDTMMAALAVAATWPGAPQALRDEVAAEVKASPVPCELAMQILTRGWTNMAAEANGVEAMLRAEFLSCLGRHREAIDAAFDLRACLEEYTGGVLPLGFVFAVGKLLLSETAVRFERWLVRECFCNGYWADKSESPLESFGSSVTRICVKVPSLRHLQRLCARAESVFHNSVPSDVALVIQARMLSFVFSSSAVHSIVTTLPRGSGDALFDKNIVDSLLESPPHTLGAVAIALKDNGNTKQAHGLLMAKRCIENESVLQELHYSLFGSSAVVRLATGQPWEGQSESRLRVLTAMDLLSSKGCHREALDVALQAGFIPASDKDVICAALKSASQLPLALSRVREVIDRRLPMKQYEWSDLQSVWMQIVATTHDYGGLVTMMDKILSPLRSPFTVESFMRLIPGSVADKSCMRRLLAATAIKFLDVCQSPVTEKDALVWVIQQQGADYPESSMAEECLLWLPVLSSSTRLHVLRALHGIGTGRAAKEFCAALLRNAAQDDLDVLSDTVLWAYRQSILPVAELVQFVCESQRVFGDVFPKVVGKLMAEVLTARDPPRGFHDALLPLAVAVVRSDEGSARFALEIAERTRNDELRREAVLALLLFNRVDKGSAPLCLPAEIADAIVEGKPKDQVVALMLQSPDSRKYLSVALSMARSETDTAMRLACLTRIDAVSSCLSSSQRETFDKILDDIVWRPYKDFDPVVDDKAATLIQERCPAKMTAHKRISGFREKLQHLQVCTQSPQSTLSALGKLWHIHKTNSRLDLFVELCGTVRAQAAESPSFVKLLNERMAFWGVPSQ